MSMKYIGAAFVIISSSVFGFCMAASIRKEIKQLRDFIGILNYMICELNFRLTPLAQLCELSAEQGKSLKQVFRLFAEELDKQISPDPARCMDAALSRTEDISGCVVLFFREFGGTIGKFDLEGQVSELKSLREKCSNALCVLEKSRDIRIRNCQTLGFCIGVAMTIILL